jgi:hypothetical protein
MSNTQSPLALVLLASALLGTSAPALAAGCTVTEWIVERQRSYTHQGANYCDLFGAIAVTNDKWGSGTQTNNPAISPEEAQRIYVACTETLPGAVMTTEVCDIGFDYSFTTKVKTTGRVVQRAKYCKAPLDNPGVDYTGRTDVCPDTGRLK